MSAIPSKIQSFFDNGFIPGGKGLGVKKSFDSKTRQGVSLNCISKVEGIATSLLHPAKGGLTVTLEEKIGDGGILDQALKANEEAIRNKERELIASLPPFMCNMALASARHAILKTDKNFIDSVSVKIHKSALFVLDVQMEEGENISIDGCKEVSREYISPDKIIYVYISEEAIGDVDDPRIICIPSVLKSVNFSYKDEFGEPKTIDSLGPMNIPDYYTALGELSLQEDRKLEENPIYSHMTRL